MILHGIEAGDGPPVVLLHGLFGAARNWGTMQRALTSRYRVIALDMRNHGASPHMVGMRYAGLAADVIETLQTRKAWPAAMVGHSMGGKAAMVLALTHPEAVGRLLVSDIAPVAYHHGNAGVAAALKALPMDISRADADAALTAVVTDAGVRAFLLNNRSFGPHAAWRIGLDEIAAAVPDLEGWDQPAQAPYPGLSLFVTGAQSDYVLPEHRPTIRALFPTARFVGIKGAGHWVHADNPAGFLSVLEAFLTGWGT